jgi:hypothetical protein
MKLKKYFLFPSTISLKKKPEEYTVKLEVHPSYKDEDGKMVELLPVQKLGLPVKIFQTMEEWLSQNPCLQLH